MAKKTEPVLSASSMKAHIEKDPLKNVYLFYGQDEFLKSYFSGLVIKKIGVDRESVKHFDGKLAAGDLRAELDSSFLFAETTVAVIKNSGYFKTISKSAAEEFEFLRTLEEDCFAIFIENEAEKNNVLFKLFEECGAVYDCSLRSLSEVTGSLVKRANMNGAGITSEAIRLLYEGLGPELFGLYNEVDRLALLVPEGVIDEELVLKESPLSTDAKMYDFTDAVVEKNFDKAMKYLDAMLKEKVAPQYILVSVSRHYQALYDVRCLADQRLSALEIAEKTGIKEWQVKKYLRQCGLYDRATIANMIDMISELDMSSKNGEIDAGNALELIIGTGK